MKRTLFFILVVILATIFLIWNAEAGFFICGPEAAEPSGCPGGTYVLYWDGDHTDGTTTACLDSGNSTSVGSTSGAQISTSYGETGYGVYFDAQDEYLRWSLAADDFDETTSKTAYIRFRCDTDGTDENIIAFEVYYDAENYFAGMLDDNEVVTSYWEGSNTIDNSQSSGTWTRDGSTWHTAGFTVDMTGAGQDHGASVDAGSTWTTDNDGPATWATGADYWLIGNLNRYQSGGDPCEVDKIIILEGYQTACPW